MKSPRCQMCGRKLKAAESLKNGVGPECADKLQRFVGGCGTSVEEIGALALVDDATTARWLRLFAGAMRARRDDHATRFIQAARRAAVAHAESLAPAEVEVAA